ncbi:MAG: hypothetical protein H8E21_04690 [Gammaproteobacteria bacterium]|nr:hypothetical protein [Gammaproteobacteria bacterium]
MLQYVFFHQQPFQLFIDFVKSKGLLPQSDQYGDSLEVRLAEDLDDDLLDLVDDEYDRLFEMNRQLMDREETSEQEYSMAAVDVILTDGRISQAFIKPELINRIMAVMTPQQFGEVVKSIVQAVENPDARSYCERVREDGEE